MAVDPDRVALDADFGRKAAVNAVEAKQVGVGFYRAQIVDRDDFNVLAAAFNDGAKHITANSSKPIDRNPYAHKYAP